MVAVHGLHADSESTWGNSSERLTQNLFSGQRVRIMSYDYYKTDTLGGIYTRKRFSEEALKLLERLVGWRAKSQKVSLITHFTLVKF